MLYNKPEKCFITNLETYDYNSPSGKGFNCIKYKINLRGKEIPLIFSPYPSNWLINISNSEELNIQEVIKSEINPYKHILCGLIYNNKLKINEDNLINKEFIKKIISENIYPNTIKDKLDNLFLKLIELQSYDGEEINLLILIYKNEFWKDLYFKNVNELNFYLQTLIEQGLISNPENIRLAKDGKFISMNITYKGQIYATQLKEEGEKSNKCFVAMSFDKDEDEIFFQAIRPACEETGFEAKRIDYENYNCEQTINDALISLIKQCKFCIADFTKQKDGVYFEAGYAAGRGMDVIYTCRKDYFDKTHFDTNHFPHIIYNNNEELKESLINKINVRIIE